MLNETEMQEIEKRAMDALNAPGSERQEQRFAPDPAPQSELTRLALANQTAQLRIAQLEATVRELQRQNEELRAELDGNDLPLRDKLEMAEGVIASQLERMAELQRQVAELEAALKRIAEMTDGDNADSYRADDSEGCLDAVHTIAIDAAMAEDKTHDR